ncbi:unnamed protein product [Rotaria magnacalcarata]
MRTKHGEAYEKSKKVAMKRIAWTTDEDLVLAKLEIKLKATQKGQILERLTTEYNKIASRSNSHIRSKEAIRGRRQQKEYKVVMEKMLSKDRTDLDTESDDDSKSNNSYNDASSDDSDASDATTNILDDNIQAIRRFVEDKLVTTKIQLTPSMHAAVDAFVNMNSTVDMLELSMAGIREAISNLRLKNAHRGTRAIRTNNNSVNGKPIRNAKRYEKARKLGYYQRLFYQNKEKLVAELIDGVQPNVEPPPIDVAVEHYEKIWSKKFVDSAIVEPKTSVGGAILLAPITIDEINWAITNTKKTSATGLDQITLLEAKAIATTQLLAAFNIWLGLQRIPLEVKQNKTVLIPKGTTCLDDIKNWRPITIASMILRLYNKVIGYRMNKVFKTSDKQAGFKPVNGCGINVAWLHSILKHARMTKTTLYTCLLDVSKAFDSVSHDSIIRALKRNGAPTEFIRLIADQYEDVSTTIKYKDISSKQIVILCGVKQGDPLSSILFNLVIDELFEVLGDQYGYAVEGIGKSNARCFADDLALASSSKLGMGELLSKTITFLEARGLAINPAKSISLGLVKGYKGKKSKIETEPAFSINGVQIPMLGYINNTTRYLGIQFTSLGAIGSGLIKTQINEVLDKLVKVKHKAQCKIELLRTHIIPKFIFKLINTELYPTMIRHVDIAVRQVIRKILHLSAGLSNEFFHLPAKEGGLEFPVLQELVGLAKVKLYRNIALQNDVFLRNIVEMQGSGMNERYLNHLKLGGQPTADDLRSRKDCLLKEKRTAYIQKVHSTGHEVFSTCALTNTWLLNGQRSMKTRMYINAIKLRTNSYETRVTTTRGLDVDKTCRKCHRADESLMHVLQCCESTKGPRYTRHHHVCSRVTMKLAEAGYTVYTEKSLPDPNNTGHLLRPDIIAVRAGQAIVLDVSCVYETSGAAFLNAYNRKVQKYKPLIPAIKEKYDCGQVEVHGLIIGSRGSYHHGQLHIWHNIGFTANDLKFLAINCMENSVRVAAFFGQSIRSSWT